MTAMDWRAIVRTRLTEITGDAARDEDIVEELAEHLAQRFDEAYRAGASRDEALEMAAAELRDSAAIRRAIADAERARPAAPAPPPAEPTQWLRDLGLDLRYTSRLLRRTPGFTVSALLTMTLGIGMTASIFSVVQAVLLEPAPFADADRLLMVWQTDRSSGTMREPGSIPDFFDYVERSQTIDRFGGFSASEANLQLQRGDPVRLAALAATSVVLELLGVQAVAGRTFTADEYRPGGAFAVLISERLWETRFDRDPSVVGTTLRVNERPATVVGIVPADSDFGMLQILSSAAYARGFADRDARTRVDIWSPIQPNLATAPRERHGLFMIGRLGPGAAVESAQEEMTRIAADLERTYPVNDARGVFLEPLQDVIFGRVRTPLMVLLAAVVLVLLISCVNLANLLLARGAARAQEITVRVALGAETSCLIRQFVVENTVLMLLAAALGLGFAYAALSTLVAIGPSTIPRLTAVGLDLRVLMLTLSLSVCVGLVFGFFPVTRIQATRLRSTLVVVQVATAVVLVTAAGLLIRSFWLIQRTSPGFDARGVLTAEVALPASRYPVDFRRAAPGFDAFNRFKDELIARVAALPGVEAAAMAGAHPLDAGFTTSFAVIGRERPPAGRNCPCGR
jgi:predicted permease